MASQSIMAGPAAPRVRVLIIDDSIVARSVLGRMVEASGRFTVAAGFASVSSALHWLGDNEVELILLDIEMPGTNGLTALPSILQAAGGAKVLVVSSSADEGAAVSIQALAAGAADTLVKPGIGIFAGRFAEVLEERLGRLCAPTPIASSRSLSLDGKVKPRDIDIVVVGASTGGIHALSQFLRAIPPSFTTPILITQHLPGSFMAYFAAQIAVLGHRACEVAHDYMRVRHSHIIVAPGDAHIRVVRTSVGTAVRLSKERATSGCMPSVDPMFASVAEVYGERAVGVVLSGMGRDGCEGAGKLVASGARIFAQDQASSVVWGMPGAVANAGYASAIASPEEIGKLLLGGRGQG